MSGFTDEIMEDLNGVFLDLDTFGSEHKVNGNVICIMFDNTELERVSKKGNEFRDDIHQGDVLFFAKETDLGSELHPGELMSLDGKDWFVHSAELEGGLWKIVLGRKQL